MMTKNTIAIIGSGIAGIAASIRLAKKGYSVQVFEKNAEPGGKLQEITVGSCRFDKGPSLFTLPELVEELFLLCGEKSADFFTYQKLSTLCHYYYPDGTFVCAPANSDQFAEEMNLKLGVKKSIISKHLIKMKDLYEATADIFLFNSLYKWSNYFQHPAYRKALFFLPKMKAFSSMHHENEKTFHQPKATQLFDRYATFNGSNPYSAPATLNMIAHLENNMGAFFPDKGMYSIVRSLVDLAKRQGVIFHFNSSVEKVIIEKNKIRGIKVNDEFIPFEYVISDIDVYTLYSKLMPEIKMPRTLQKMERSSSALIFYWSINKSFPSLDLHNILFSGNYQQEFQSLFSDKTIYSDPTVYIFISSKKISADAPKGFENWFVMVNAPENIGQDWDAMIAESRKHILNKIHSMLGVDIQKLIVAETISSPVTIESDTASFRGSLYGTSSNSILAAFRRHANWRSSIKNMYFLGGSVHPGGGIPLCLASAKIIDQEFVPIHLS